MAQALGKISVPESAQSLAKALSDPSFYPRDEAAWSLGRLGALAVPEVESLCDSLSVEARPFAALALGLSGVEHAESRAAKLLEQGLLSECDLQRRDAAYFAGELAHLEPVRLLVPYINRLLLGSDDLVRVGCWALGCFSLDGLADVDLGKIKSLASRHNHPLVRYEAVVALGKWAQKTGGPEILSTICAATSDPIGRVRYGAVQSLRLLAQAGGCAPDLMCLTNDDDFGVRFEGDLLEQQGA
jgi:HEAT repeat protein